jgi:hypothetical protein
LSLRVICRRGAAPSQCLGSTWTCASSGLALDTCNVRVFISVYIVIGRVCLFKHDDVRGECPWLYLCGTNCDVDA